LDDQEVRVTGGKKSKKKVSDAKKELKGFKKSTESIEKNNKRRGRWSDHESLAHFI